MRCAGIMADALPGRMGDNLTIDNCKLLPMPTKQRYPLMKRVLQAWVFLLFSALFAFSQAASLGRLTVLSSLGQPLRAEVELRDVTDDEADGLAVALAPVEAYKRSGLDYPALLQTLDITVVKEGERRFARIRSDQPVSEPYIGLLLELATGQERKGREYALALDTAERTSLRSAPLSSVASLERLSRQQRVERLFTRAAPADAARPDAVLGSQEGQTKPATSRYVVARGDTLSKIAARLSRRDISLEQMLVALYRNNPEAFLDNNMNLLKEGASLSIPDVDNGADVSRSEARSVVRLHATNFSDYSQKLAGMARRSSPRSAPTAGQVAEGRISAKVKETPTPASRLPDRLELSRARPDESQSGMTAEEKVAITQAVEENRHRIVELEKNVGELRSLLEVVSETGSAMTSPAQEQATDKAGAPEKTLSTTAKTDKKADTATAPDGEQKSAASDTEEAIPADKADADANRTLEKAAASKEEAKADEKDEKNEEEAASDDSDEDEEGTAEKENSKVSDKEHQNGYDLNNRLVWLVAAVVTLMVLALIAWLFLLRRKKRVAPIKTPVQETVRHEKPEEVFNPNIISGREFLENLPKPDMMDDEENTVESIKEDAPLAEPDGETADEDASFQVEEAPKEAAKEAQETEPEMAKALSSVEKGEQEDAFVSLDQASVEGDKEEPESVSDAAPPENMALPDAQTDEAAFKAENAAIEAEALTDVDNEAKEDAESANQPDMPAVSVKEMANAQDDNAEKARSLELDLSDIDLSAAAEEGDEDLANVAKDQEGNAGAAEAEMAAKLELAMTYLGMKDKEGARELLEEVIAKGTPQQAEEAAQAMQSL